MRCPKCKGEMEKKGYIPDEDCGDGCCSGNMDIWQCEGCKNIEID